MGDVCKAEDTNLTVKHEGGGIMRQERLVHHTGSTYQSKGLTHDEIFYIFKVTRFLLDAQLCDSSHNTPERNHRFEILIHLSIGSYTSFLHNSVLWPMQAFSPCLEPSKVTYWLKYNLIALLHSVF